ncbi:hypothetical protein MMC22_003512 [Lobaria immixta]|nr:hypothetical protein [Lobaria immixta]
MECICLGELLICGASQQPILWPVINYCLSHCACGPETTVIRATGTKELSYGYSYGYPSKSTAKTPSSPSTNTIGSTHTCSGTCTSVDRGCASSSTGDCTCFAPPVGPFFWHQGDCGTRLPFKAKRDLAQQRLSYYRNATGRFASSNKAAAPPGPLPDHAAQLASGLLPSPCNASYVSFACSDSPDGIVHEPPQNWLGALLPKGVNQPPPVPERFLSIHGKEGKLQVTVEEGVR